MTYRDHESGCRMLGDTCAQLCTVLYWMAYYATYWPLRCAGLVYRKVYGEEYE